MRLNNICCDVCSCMHNDRGCECSLDKVKVTTNEDLKTHFCGSYKIRPEYEEPTYL